MGVRTGIHRFETSRLTLRPWKTDDEAEASELFRYASNPAVGEMCGWAPHKSAEESARIIRDILDNPHTFAIVLKETGRPIGSIDFHPVSSDTRSFLAEGLRSGAPAGGEFVEIDIPREDVSALGEVAAHPDRARELGYWIGEPYWGNGFAAEAGEAVKSHCFGRLGLRAVLARHFVGNPASGRVMQKLGIRRIGRINDVLMPLLHGNVRRDEFVYAVVEAQAAV